MGWKSLNDHIRLHLLEFLRDIFFNDITLEDFRVGMLDHLGQKPLMAIELQIELVSN